jgi:S-adenosylmethionine hydrolase
LKAGIQRIEEKLQIQKAIQLKSTGILETRNKLNALNSAIAETELKTIKENTDDKELTKLKLEAEKAKDEIRNQVQDLYSYGNSIDGLPVNALLNDWISNVIEYEATKAGLEVLGERIKEFQKQYSIYAPAGATIKRIEREISVSEQEFLEILHGLNLAKLKLQDAELSATIKLLTRHFIHLPPTQQNAKF